MKILQRLLFLLLPLLLAACGRSDDLPPTVDPAAPDTLILAAGSEVKDLEPLLERLRRETGVTLVLRYTGTLDGIERIAAGEDYDGAWFSHAKYLMLVPDAATKVRAAERIMLSPVLLGVKESVARRFGWGATTTWAAVAEQAGRGNFHFAMTNPASSNSGFSALVGVAASFAGKTDALEAGDIRRDRLATLFKGQALTAGSSGWLAERYLEEQDKLDGIINYESVLLSLNRGGKLKEKLTLIYPQEGLLTADYPLLLLNEQKRGAYLKAVNWLRGSEAQNWLMTHTLRRPAVPTVPPDRSLFGDALLVDMAFPGKLSVINALLTSYLGEQRPPASMYFVLDLSGSMGGFRVEDLRRALRVLAGQEGQTLSSGFVRFQPRERVTLVPFSSRVHQQEVQRLEVSRQRPGEALERLAHYADHMAPGGGTAMYDGLISAYRMAAKEMADSPGRYYTVVVMTDGKSNEGATLQDFQQWLAQQPARVRQIKAFSVLIGDGNEQELRQVAAATGGRFFDSRKTSLTAMFKEIRGYQ